LVDDGRYRLYFLPVAENLKDKVLHLSRGLASRANGAVFDVRWLSEFHAGGHCRGRRPVAAIEQAVKTAGQCRLAHVDELF